MSGFTPAPWWVRGDGGVTILAKKTHIRGDGAVVRYEGEVARVQPQSEHGQRKANARLIAAAPELYEALVRVMDAYGFDPSIDSSIWNEAGKALLKARGEQA